MTTTPPPPEFRPVKGQRLAPLRWAEAPPAPQLRTDDTDDEAEIQFRAAFTFYRKQRWGYAAAALAEALTYDEDRDDARFYQGASLVMANRNEEAVLVLEPLMETPYEMRARALLAPAYMRLGKPEQARQAALPAAGSDYRAAAWVAVYDLLR